MAAYVVLELLGRHGRTLDVEKGWAVSRGQKEDARRVRFERLAAHEEVLQILQNVLLRRGEGFWLGHLLEGRHACVDTADSGL